MKVILKQTIAKVGKEGQVVQVADGFARNFLFPRGLAVLADKPSIALLEKQKEKLATQLENTLVSAKEVAEKIDGKTIRITGKTAKGSIKLFGAVTTADIVDSIKENLNVEIERKNVALLHPIKRIGVHDILIDLHRDVDATVKLEITDEFGNLGLETEEALHVEPVEFEETDTTQVEKNGKDSKDSSVDTIESSEIKEQTE
jgi:large subunit ribosomal protein L9